MCFTGYIIFTITCWNRFYFFIVWLYNFITRNHWIIHNTCQIFSIFTITCSRIPNIIFFTYMIFLHSYRHLSLFHHWFHLHFVQSKLHLHSHDICLVNAFDSLIPVIMLNTLRFKSSVLFGIQILLDKSFKALHLPRHLSNLTANG